MVSRSVNFQFQVDERVLCFEPDPNKARVLYEAKILETGGAGRDSGGPKAPEYLIHFNGWSSSWDRHISEEHLLKVTPENLALAKRLRDVARGIRSNSSRKRKIEEILDSVFNRQRKRLAGGSQQPSEDGDARESGGGSDEDTLSADEKTQTTDTDIVGSYGSTDGSNLPIDGFDKVSCASDTAISKRSRSIRQRRKRVSSIASGKSSRKGDQNGKAHGDDENGACTYALPPDVAPPSEAARLELPLPSNLRKILINDCRQTRKKLKLTALPVQPSVLHILEHFLGQFTSSTDTSDAAAGADPSSVPKTSQARDPLPASADSQESLAEEVAEGVRILFDYTLPLILLYAEEREQYSDMFSSSSVGLGDLKDACPLPPRPASVDGDCVTDASTAEAVPLRLTRPPLSNVSLAVQGKVRAAASSGSCQPGTSSEPRAQLHRHASVTQGAATADSTVKDCSDPAGRTAAVALRSAPNPPQTISAADGPSCAKIVTEIRHDLHHRCSNEEPTDGIVPSYMPQSTVVQQSRVAARRSLLPEQHRIAHPPLPCTIYGLPHLLRLLVKLPDLVSRMQMTAERCSIVQHILQSFVRFLSEEAAEEQAAHCTATR